MTKDFTRRQVLGLGAAAGAAMVGSGLTGFAVASDAPADVYEWKKVNAKKAAKAAYEAYFVGGCMYAVWKGVMSQFEKQGAPYSTFPHDMMKYGSGGVALWGTICGTTNGAAAIAGLFVTDGGARTRIVNELFKWYQESKLPVYSPKKAIKVEGKIKSSQADSVLCHASIQNWCAAANDTGFTATRAERCGRLCADVTGKLVNLINDNMKNKLKVTYSDEACLSCHGNGGIVGTTLAKMGCTSCHESH